MRTNGDEITKEGVEEEEEEGDDDKERDSNGGVPNQISSTQATVNCRQKRSLCRGFSKLISTNRRKRKKKKESEEVSDFDSVPSRPQTGCCLVPACFARPQYLSPDSPLSDVTFRSLIEQNDFYTPECNVHRNGSVYTREH